MVSYDYCLLCRLLCAKEREVRFSCLMVMWSQEKTLWGWLVVIAIWGREFKIGLINIGSLATWKLGLGSKGLGTTSDLENKESFRFGTFVYFFESNTTENAFLARCWQHEKQYLFPIVVHEKEALYSATDHVWWQAVLLPDILLKFNLMHHQTCLRQFVPQHVTNKMVKISMNVGIRNWEILFE